MSEMIKFIVAGSVDDGKSTFIGRLMVESGSIYDDQFKSINNKSGDIDLAFITDGLKAEREQGITIDVAYRHFTLNNKRYMVIDAPGHEQYTKNMATGASNADLAFILIDAERGIKPQTIRHSFICSLFGIKHIVLLVNKMDSVNFDKIRFKEICDQYESAIAKLDIIDLTKIPISALKGDNLITSSKNMKWYSGPTVNGYLETFSIRRDYNFIDLRLPIQYVSHGQAGRFYCGTIASGTLKLLDDILICPSNIKAKISDIYVSGVKANKAKAGEAIAVSLDKDIDVNRGDIFSHINNSPQIVNQIEAMVICVSSNINIGNTYIFKSNCGEVKCEIHDILYKIGYNDLHKINVNKELDINDSGRITLNLFNHIPIDTYLENNKTGNFTLINEITNDTVAAGVVINRAKALKSEKKQRTIWMTGLSGAGKTTIAKYLKSRISTSVYILDGDELRKGINNNLGFSLEDRQENIRRVAEVAKILNNAGILVIVSVISPCEIHRKIAKEIIGDSVLEVYINTPLKICKQRDPKGLYAARTKNMTGIDSIYEPPKNPDLIIDTSNETVEESAKKILNILHSK